MSKQANPRIIGAFVVGALALVVAGVLILGSGRFFKERKNFVMFFEGSVQGLNKGAAVAFKGVRIGSVTDIKVLFNTKQKDLLIPVFVEIEPDRFTQTHGVPLDQVMEGSQDKTIVGYLVEKGLRAELNLQSLVTGQLFVNLDFFPGKPARYVSNDTSYPEIPTVPSSLEVLSKTVEQLPISELASKANKVLKGIERWLNSPELKDIVDVTRATMKNVESTTQSINEQIKPILTGLDRTLSESQGLAHDLRVQVEPLAADAKEISKGTKELVGTINRHLTGLASNMEKTLSAAQMALTKAEGAFGGIEGAVGDDSRLRFEFTNALKEFSAAARSVRTLADYLDRHPEALLHGKGGEGKVK
jgi:paraquat-inducible protein B